MLCHALDRAVLRYTPGVLPGAAIHRHALAAVAAGRVTEAEPFFEAAAAAYRRELRVEPLARLRVHQSLARARACDDPGLEAVLLLEIVRSLNRLDQLESLRPPFAMQDAREVLSEWLADGAGAGAAPPLSRAA